jgi:3-dehydroquinate synthase
MSDFSVRTSAGAYGVNVGYETLLSTLATAPVVVIDDAVAASRSIEAGPSTIPFHASESTKTLAGCQDVLIAMHERGMKRGDTLLAVGGGALQDVATLASSIYMRGVPWIYAPTTAMSMLDSCIGGKSSINVAGIKNLVGNIYPPAEVVVDLALAESLPIAARVSGLSEAVKICFASGPESLAEYLALDVAPEEFGAARAADRSVALVAHVLMAKRWFIEVDEFDKKERLLLNFGHTFGHALESATGFILPHGVAVAFGMIAALKHPQSQASIQTEELRRYIVEILRRVPLSAVAALEGIDWATYRSAIASDKKGTREAIRLILPARESPLAMVDIPRTDAAMAELEACMQMALSVDLV